MSVLICKKCESKVESNRCCGEPMHLKGTALSCKKCNKTVDVNRCCGQSMNEMK